MFRNFIQLAFRNFLKNSSYTIINVLGLSVGLAAFIILTLFVKYELGYDTFHEGTDRMYRVEEQIHLANEVDIWSQIPAPVSNTLQERYAEIEEAITIREVWGEYLSTSKKRTFFEPDGYYANSDIFNLFNIKFISGNKKTALDSPMKIVLTESIANKLFPDTEPMGQNILVDNKRTYIVSGVIEDVPFNTNTPLTYLIPFSTYKSLWNESFLDHWDWDDTRVYIKLKEGVDKEKFEQKIAFLFDEFREERDDKLLLTPIKMIHLVDGNNFGYLIVVTLYGIVGLFTLVLAALNFVNLTTAYSLTRAKEIGVKKVVGSSKGRLIKQFLGESLIIVFMSLLIAFTITEASLPIFNRIVSLPLDIKYIEDWSFTLFIIGITALTGILSGFYPSLVLSSLNPLQTLKNKIFDNKRFKKFSMRKGLVVFQLIMSIVFIITTLGILGQFRYLKNKDLGFDKHNLLISRIGATEKVKINDFATLHDELLQIPGVINSSISYNSPFNGSWGRVVNWEGSQAGENMNCRFNRAYATFLNTMKINLIAGRQFDQNLASDSAACIVNETFINIIGWNAEEAIGKRVWDKDYTIIGVMNDFHEQSPYTKIQPYIMINHSGYLTGSKDLIVRIDDIADNEKVGKIKALLEEYFPDIIFEIKPFDNNLGAGTYKVYEGMAKTFGFFSLVSIIIAVIGLFALVSFSSKRKIKEIGIRKVLGASSWQIYKKLINEYIILTVVANMFAMPLGILFYKFDPSYYKTDLNYLNLVITGILSFVITIIIISIQVIKSSNANPVDSLRYE